METGHHYAWSFPTLMKGNRILVDETFDGTPAGTLPSGWLITNSNNTRAAVLGMTAGSDKSLKITDSNVDGASLVRKTFPAQSGTVSAQWSFMEPSYFSKVKFGLKSGANFATELYTVGSNIVYKDNLGRYITIQPFKTDTWYTVAVIANPKTSTYNLYINGFLKKANAPFSNRVTSLDSFGFYSGWSQKGTF